MSHRSGVTVSRLVSSSSLSACTSSEASSSTAAACTAIRTPTHGLTRMIPSSSAVAKSARTGASASLTVFDRTPRPETLAAYA